MGDSGIDECSECNGVEWRTESSATACGWSAGLSGFSADGSSEPREPALERWPSSNRDRFSPRLSPLPPTNSHPRFACESL